MSTLASYEKALPIALLRAREATLSRFRGHVQDHGLTLEQWRVLRALAEHEQLDTRSLSTLCVLLPPSLSRILKTLEAKGLITVSTGKDRRHRFSQLTPAGRTLFEDMAAKTLHIHRDIEAAFGAEKLRALITLLDDLQGVLNPPEETEAL